MQIQFRSGAAGKCELPGVGTATRHGFHRRWRLELEDGRTLELRRVGVPRWRLRLTSETGAVVGEYRQVRLLRGEGPIRLASRTYRIVTTKRAPSTLDLLHDGERVASGHGNPREASVHVDHEGIDPVLLLFFACLVDQYAVTGNGVDRLFRKLFELLSWW